MTYAAEVLADSPTLYWRLGEPSGTTVVDASGNGHTGTYVNAPTLGATGLLTGDADTAMTVTYQATFAASQYAVSNATFTGTSLISLEAWVTLNTMTTYQTIIGFDSSTGAFEYGYIFTTPTGQVVFNGTGGFFAQSASGAIATGVPCHIVGTYDGANAFLYIDGLLAATSTGGSPWALVEADSFYVGSDEYDGDAADATIDEAAFYRTFLTQERIIVHYNAGVNDHTPYADQVTADSPLIAWRLNEPSGTTVLDNSGNGHDGTYVGSPTLNQPSYTVGDAAVEFSGATQDATGNDTFGPTDYPGGISVEAIFTVNTLPDSFIVMGLGTATDGIAGFTLSSVQNVSFGFVGPSPTFNQHSSLAGTFVVGVPYHVVGVYDGGGLAYIYINGIPLASNAAGDAPEVPTGSTVDLVHRPNSDNVDITIDEFAFYESALSPTRVVEHFRSIPNPGVVSRVVAPTTLHTAASVPAITLAGAPGTSTQFRLSEFLLARLKFTPAQKYRAVPQIQNFVTHITALPAIADITQTPLAVLFDAFDGDEWNMFTMNSDGTARTQVTSDS